jgi:hypothetical protein
VTSKQEAEVKAGSKEKKVVTSTAEFFTELSNNLLIQ